MQGGAESGSGPACCSATLPPDSSTPGTAGRELGHLGVSAQRAHLGAGFRDWTPVHLEWD